MKKICILFMILSITLGGILPSMKVGAEEVAEVSAESEEKKEEIKSPYLDIVPETNLIKNWVEGPKIHSEGACVMDLDSGAVLYGKNLHLQLYPASTTKIMTTLVALENSHLGDKVTFSKTAIESNPWDGTNAGIVEGEELSVEDVLYAIMLVSANEACSGIGEHISGSVPAFVDLMNEKAKALGCKDTHFVTPNGLHNKDHYTTPYDLALISRAAFSHQEFQKIVGSRHHEIGKTNKSEEKKDLYNSHKILMDTDYHRDECVGGKTGFTDEALNTLVTFVSKDGRRLVIVTMHGNGAIWAVEDTIKLMDFGLSSFKEVPLSYQDIDLKTQGLRASLMQDAYSQYHQVFYRKPWLLSIPFGNSLILPNTLDLSQLDVQWHFLSGSKQIWEGDYQYFDYPMGKTYIRLRPPNYRKYYSGIQLVPWQTVDYQIKEKENMIYNGSILLVSFLLFLVSFFFSLLQGIRAFRVRRKKIHKKRKYESEN